MRPRLRLFPPTLHPAACRVPPKPLRVRRATGGEARVQAAFLSRLDKVAGTPAAEVQKLIQEIDEHPTCGWLKIRESAVKNPNRTVGWLQAALTQMKTSLEGERFAEVGIFAALLHKLHLAVVMLETPQWSFPPAPIFSAVKLKSDLAGRLEKGALEADEQMVLERAGRHLDLLITAVGQTLSVVKSIANEPHRLTTVNSLEMLDLLWRAIKKMPLADENAAAFVHSMRDLLMVEGSAWIDIFKARSLAFGERTGAEKAMAFFDGLCWCMGAAVNRLLTAALGAKPKAECVAFVEELGEARLAALVDVFAYDIAEILSHLVDFKLTDFHVHTIAPLVERILTQSHGEPPYPNAWEPAYVLAVADLISPRPRFIRPDLVAVATATLRGLPLEEKLQICTGVVDFLHTQDRTLTHAQIWQKIELPLKNLFNAPNLNDP